MLRIFFLFWLYFFHLASTFKVDSRSGTLIKSIPARQQNTLAQIPAKYYRRHSSNRGAEQKEISFNFPFMMLHSRFLIRNWTWKSEKSANIQQTHANQPRSAAETTTTSLCARFSLHVCRSDSTSTQLTHGNRSSDWAEELQWEVAVAACCKLYKDETGTLNRSASEEFHSTRWRLSGALKRR